MKKYTVIFFFITFLIGTDTFLVAPLLPTLSRYYQVSTSISGWLVSAYAIGYACFALLSGPFSDGRDRKKVLFWGMLAFTLSTFLCGLSENFVMMLVFRLLAGISASFVTPQVWASIPVVIKRECVVQATGYVTAGFAVSQLIGIPIGSYLAVLSWRTPFFFVSVCTLFLSVIVLFLLPNLTVGQHSKQSMMSIFVDLFKNNKALWFLLAYFFFEMGIFAMTQFTGTWLSMSYKLTVAGIGTAMLAIGAGNLIGTLISHRVTNKFGFKWVFLSELIIIAILYIVLPFSSNLIISITMLTLNFFVNGLLFPLLMVSMQQSAPTMRSTISAFSNAVMYLGTTIDGIIGGFLITHFSGFYGVSFFAAILTIIALIVFSATSLLQEEISLV
ncbi:MFS transporter [Niallia sp. 03133]|uniref:MFS transporter n=1 Tax=Niallia sp. 03133 TaxID=3458060 RepID=UPI0040441C46